MADGLTQLQDSLDQLATQMFASLRYISAHHQLAPIENQPFHGPSDLSFGGGGGGSGGGTNHASPTTQQPTDTQTQTQTQPDTQPEDNDPNAPPRPDTPRTFAAALDELAQDLVKKEQQIETLIAALPGQGRSRAEQEARLRELDGELRGLEGEVVAARAERDELRAKVEAAMWTVRRW